MQRTAFEYIVGSFIRAGAWYQKGGLIIGRDMALTRWTYMNNYCVLYTDASVELSPKNIRDNEPPIPLDVLNPAQSCEVFSLQITIS